MAMTHASSQEVDRKRAARLEALREDLDHRLEELATTGTAGLAKVKDRFEVAWKELNELLEQTRH